MSKRRFIEFDKSFLQKLVLDPDSLVSLHRSVYHLALHPWHLNNINQSVKDLLNAEISQYNANLDGIVLGYKNLALAKLGHIHADSYFIHSDAHADFFIFKPQINKCLVGTIIKKSKDHITCRVYNCFNISIPRTSEEGWIGSDMQVGDAVKIQIEYLDYEGPTIKGIILQKEHSSKSTNQIVINDNIIPHTSIATPKKKNKKDKSVANLQSSIDGSRDEGNLHTTEFVKEVKHKKKDKHKANENFCESSQTVLPDEQAQSNEELSIIIPKSKEKSSKIKYITNEPTNSQDQTEPQMGQHEECNHQNMLVEERTECSEDQFKITHKSKKKSAKYRDTAPLTTNELTNSEGEIGCQGSQLEESDYQNVLPEDHISHNILRNKQEPLWTYGNTKGDYAREKVMIKTEKALDSPVKKRKFKDTLFDESNSDNTHTTEFAKQVKHKKKDKQKANGSLCESKTILSEEQLYSQSSEEQMNFPSIIPKSKKKSTKIKYVPPLTINETTHSEKHTEPQMGQHEAYNHQNILVEERTECSEDQFKITHKSKKKSAKYRDTAPLTTNELTNSEGEIGCEGSQLEASNYENVLPEEHISHNILRNKQEPLWTHGSTKGDHAMEKVVIKTEKVFDSPVKKFKDTSFDESNSDNIHTTEFAKQVKHKKKDKQKANSSLCESKTILSEEQVYSQSSEEQINFPSIIPKSKIKSTKIKYAPPLTINESTHSENHIEHQMGQHEEYNHQNVSAEEPVSHNILNKKQEPMWLHESSKGDHTLERVMIKTEKVEYPVKKRKFKDTSFDESNDDNGSDSFQTTTPKKKRKKRLSVSTKDDLVNSILKEKLYELDQDYSNAFLKQEEIMLPDLDMKCIAESINTTPHVSGNSGSFFNSTSLQMSDSSLDAILHSPVKKEPGLKKKTKAVKRELFDTSYDETGGHIKKEKISWNNLTAIQKYEI